MPPPDGDGIPGDPLEGGDTDETLIPVGDGDVVAMEDADTTASHKVRICTECARPVFAMLACAPPRLEDLVLPTYWERCIVSGHDESPVWWFCPWGRYFAIRGVFRVRLDRLIK